jgi:hypothetical protein
MQWPAPSHTVPPFSLHGVPFATNVAAQVLLVHDGVVHWLPAGQSEGWVHCTHVPAPSQTWPPLELHCVPAGLLWYAGVPLAQTGV